jgi:hypothetical protein
MIDALGDVVLIILIIAATVSIIIGATLSENTQTDWIEGHDALGIPDSHPGLAILGPVVIVVFVTALNNFQKEKQFKLLQAKQV